MVSLRNFLPVMPLLALAAPLAAGRETPHYAVSVKVYDGGTLLMAPSLVTDAQQSATFLKSDPSLFLQLVARPSGNGQFEISSSVVRWTKSGLWADNSNLAVTADGAPGATLLGNPEMMKAQTQPLRIVVTVATAR